MELYQLRTFAAVAETGHLTRAADRLHVSQPAVSAQIKALEEELDVRLFERGPAGMTLTRAGARLLNEAAKVLGAAEELRNVAKALTGEIAGRLRIGTIGAPEFIRLGEFSSRTVERFPLLELEFHAEVSSAALEAVRDGTFDASFYVGEVMHPNVVGLGLREITFRVVAPAAWADRVRQADWKAMAALPWILMPSMSTHSQLARTMFREHGVEPGHVIEADQESLIANLVVSGVGVSLLPDPLALDLQTAGKVCISEKAVLRGTLWFIYLRERANDPLIKGLVEVLRETWALEQPGAEVASSPPRKPAGARDRSRSAV
jgi:DNA-binding transcriptional LysR family regulator